MSTQEITFVTCQSCQSQYEAPVTAIIDVTAEPELKSKFLQGQLNVSQCPQCNTPNPAPAAIIYHDAEKEMALAYVPGGIQIAHAEEQRLIGSLTNRLMESIPQEQRKMYLFSPKTFFTMESLMKEVLAADGITDEVIEAQGRKLRLLESLLRATDEDGLKQVIAENTAELDEQFFEIITVLALQAMDGGEQVRGESLLALRQFVAANVDGGAEIVQEIDAKLGLQALTPERVLDELLAVQDDEDRFMAIIAGSRQVIDYQFFQMLTTQIEMAEAAGDATEAEKLKALRSRILDASAKIEDDTKKIVEQANETLQKLLQSDDPQSIIEENLDQFDEAFLSVMAASIQKAEQEGHQEVLQKLVALYQMIIETLQQNLPPGMMLFNQLMEASSPEEIGALLLENASMINQDFINFLEHVQADFADRGEEAMSQQAGKIKQQAELMV